MLQNHMYSSFSIPRVYDEYSDIVFTYLPHGCALQHFGVPDMRGGVFHVNTSVGGCRGAGLKIARGEFSPGNCT